MLLKERLIEINKMANDGQLGEDTYKEKYNGRLDIWAGPYCNGKSQVAGGMSSGIYQCSTSVTARDLLNEEFIYAMRNGGTYLVEEIGESNDDFIAFLDYLSKTNSVNPSDYNLIGGEIEISPSFKMICTFTVPTYLF